MPRRYNAAYRAQKTRNISRVPPPFKILGLGLFRIRLSHTHPPGVHIPYSPINTNSFIHSPFAFTSPKVPSTSPPSRKDKQIKDKTHEVRAARRDGSYHENPTYATCSHPLIPFCLATHPSLLPYSCTRAKVSPLSTIASSHTPVASRNHTLMP